MRWLERLGGFGKQVSVTFDIAWLDKSWFSLLRFHAYCHNKVTHSEWREKKVKQ